MNKLVLVFLSLTILSGCEALGIKKRPMGEHSIILNKALKSFKTEYLDAEKQRAFAQSSSGAWAWRSCRTTEEQAIKSALSACREYNSSHRPCRIIHVNDNWVE